MAWSYTSCSTWIVYILVKHVKLQRSVRNMDCCQLLSKIAGSDIVSLVHGLCGSGGSIYNKDTSQNKLFTSLIALTMIDPTIHHRLV
jgi:hypothetical protein